VASSRQHSQRPSGSNAKPGLGIKHDPNDHALDPPDGDIVFSYLARQRIRQTSQEAHSMVVDRLRHATRQGGAATPAGLAAEVVELHRAIQRARTAHGAAYDATMQRVRVCYLNIAASALILAERATRPAELKRGEKSSTTKYAAPRFEVPKA
jgi:hypothetical protein